MNSFHLADSVDRGHLTQSLWILYAPESYKFDSDEFTTGNAVDVFYFQAQTGVSHNFPGLFENSTMPAAFPFRTDSKHTH